MSLRSLTVYFLSHLKRKIYHFVVQLSRVWWDMSVASHVIVVMRKFHALYRPQTSKCMLILRPFSFSPSFPAIGTQRDCKNGKLSPKQFMEVYQVICPGGEAKEFSRHVFRTFDKDRNGFIDFKVSKWLLRPPAPSPPPVCNQIVFHERRNDPEHRFPPPPPDIK